MAKRVEFDGSGYAERDEPDKEEKGKNDWPVPIKTFTPIGCLVALYPFIQKATDKGIILPESSRGGGGRLDHAQDTVRCLVIAVGPDCKWVKEGMEVLCYNPTQLVKHRLANGDLHTTVMIREDALGGIVQDNFVIGRP